MALPVMSTYLWETTQAPGSTSMALSIVTPTLPLLARDEWLVFLDIRSESGLGSSLLLMNIFFFIFCALPPPELEYRLKLGY